MVDYPIGQQTEQHVGYDLSEGTRRDLELVFQPISNACVGFNQKFGSRGFMVKPDIGPIGKIDKNTTQWGVRILGTSQVKRNELPREPREIVSRFAHSMADQTGLEISRLSQLTDPYLLYGLYTPFSYN